MSTVADLIERVYREYLTAPDNQPVGTLLNTTIDSSTSTVIYDAFQLPEAEAMLDIGTIIEIDSECMRVTAAVDTTTRTLTVERHVMGTSAATHTATAPLLVGPTFTRIGVFNAVADAIVGLYPDLYAVTTKALIASPVMDLEDTTATSILAARYLDGTAWQDTQLTLMDGFPEVPTGPGVLLEDPTVTGTIYVTYAHRFTRPTAETDELATLGIEPAWEGIVALTAAQSQLGSQPIEYLNVEFITQALKAQGLASADFSGVSTAMLRLRNLLVNTARRDLRSRYLPAVHMNRAY